VTKSSLETINYVHAVYMRLVASSAHIVYKRLVGNVQRSNLRHASFSTRFSWCITLHALYTDVINADKFINFSQVQLQFPRVSAKLLPLTLDLIS
jgi:hypothetical protein